jgi:hypothetical protein
MLLSLLYRWGNWGSERLNDLSRVTRLVSVRAGIQIQSVWALKLLLTILDVPCPLSSLGGGPAVLGAESHASRDVAIDMVDSRTSQQLQLIDEQVLMLRTGEDQLP